MAFAHVRVDILAFANFLLKRVPARLMQRWTREVVGKINPSRPRGYPLTLSLKEIDQYVTILDRAGFRAPFPLQL
jgi:hypothetical protein